MQEHMHAPRDLTKNQSLVMSELSKANGPLSAYMILDQLRDEGLRAPLQIYRALDKLVELGFVHRIESLNAFVACRHEDCATQKTVSFMICEDCGEVSELASDKVSKTLTSLSQEKKFRLERSTIELRGVCQNCQTD